MTSYFKRLKLSIRRRLGYPEVSILVMGDDNPATRNRIKLLRANVSISEYLLDNYFTTLPYSSRFRFPSKLFEPFEGILYLIDASKEENIKNERNYLWEKILWDSATNSIPIAFCAYNSDLQGALARGELIEALSLIRITDRQWNIFETPTIQDMVNALQWLKQIVHMGYVKSWELKEKLIPKLQPLYEIQINQTE
ncbi:MAG: ADP-ribosylation factor-like protein [Candidatus Heimdallarchaeaceae archaeon]